MPATKTSVGNEFRAHVAQEDSDIFILQAQEEGGCIGEGSGIVRHPLHSIVMLVFESLSNRPIRQEGSNLKSGEQTTVSEVPNGDIVAPVVGIVLLAPMLVHKLTLVAVVEERQVLVPDHSRTKEETSLMLSIYSSHAKHSLINGTEVGSIGQSHHTNLFHGSQQTVNYNLGKELGNICGSSSGVQADVFEVRDGRGEKGRLQGDWRGGGFLGVVGDLNKLEMGGSCGKSFSGHKSLA